MSLEIKNLSFAYGSKAILNNISFTAKKGECTALLGVNGAGKSTLLKCVSGILRYKKGSILSGGVELGTLSPEKRARLVGYVPQRVMFEDCTVFDAVLAGRKPYIKWEASAGDFEKVRNVLEKMEITDLSLRNVCELSGGEQQKTAVARTLAQEAEVILFDEPTCNLDLTSQIYTAGLIRKTAENGAAAVVTMHDINLALRFCDRFVMIKDGKVLYEGDAEVITDRSIYDVFGVEAQVVEINGKKVVINDI